MTTAIPQRRRREIRQKQAARDALYGVRADSLLGDLHEEAATTQTWAWFADSAVWCLACGSLPSALKVLWDAAAPCAICGLRLDHPMMPTTHLTRLRTRRA